MLLITLRKTYNIKTNENPERLNPITPINSNEVRVIIKSIGWGVGDIKTL